MRFSITSLRPALHAAALAAAFAPALLAGTARAESAYVAQVAGTVIDSLPPQLAGPARAAIGQALSRGQSSFTPTPETARPANGGNFASTLQIGSYNQVFQVQSGANNQSSVGILGGVANKVGVLQSGNNLKSNLVLLNTVGMNVGVLQGPNSTPLNMLIARLPNGGLLIKK